MNTSLGRITLYVITRGQVKLRIHACFQKFASNSPESLTHAYGRDNRSKTQVIFKYPFNFTRNHAITC